MAVVALDQVVDLAEVPGRGELAPASLELLAGRLLPQLRERLRELRLVQADRELDRPQPSHPGERAAECGELRARVRPAVAPPPPERLPGDRAPADVLRPRL